LLKTIELLSSADEQGYGIGVCIPPLEGMLFAIISSAKKKGGFGKATSLMKYPETTEANIRIATLPVKDQNEGYLTYHLVRWRERSWLG